MLIDARNRKIISDDGTIICKHGVSDIMIINNDQTVKELVRDKNGDYDYSEFKEYREELKLLKVLIDMDLDKKEEQYEAV